MNPITYEIKKFLFALQFLTIIKIKFIEWDEEFAAKSVTYFPIVGILIGCILAVMYFILSFIFPTNIITILIIIIGIVLVRGLHLDGFMDTTDGLFGGKNKEDRLRIMNDSCVGSFGVVAIVLLIMFKFVLISEILNLSLPKFFVAQILMLMPALGRYAMIIPMVIYPYARTDGTAHFTKFVRKKEILIATLLMLLSLMLLFGLSTNFNFHYVVLLLMLLTVLVIASIVFSLLLSKYIASKIDGMTGDTYGAITEISEVCVLFLVVLMVVVLKF